jgi:hypothetical protein
MDAVESAPFMKRRDELICAEGMGACGLQRIGGFYWRRLQMSRPAMLSYRPIGHLPNQRGSINDKP